jgi:cell division transport system permease protein
MSRLSGYFAHHGHALVSSAGHLARSPAGTLFTIIVMGLALALPVGLDALVRNVRAATGDFSGAISVSAYMKAGTSEARARQVAGAVRARAEVARVQLVTAEEAMRQFRAQSGFGAALDALEGNPLPHTLVVTPTASASDPAAVENLRRALAAWPEMDVVQLDGAWVTRFNALVGLLRAALLVSAALLAAGVVAVVGNTIRLEIRTRRTEVEVTKLVGGTNGFVRRPFLYTGALYGLLAGLLAWLVVETALLVLAPAAAQLAAAYGSAFHLQGLGFAQFRWLVGGGMALGWIGAWLAAGRELSRIDPGSITR